MEGEINQYKNENDSIQNIGRVKEVFQKFVNNPILQKLGEAMRCNGSENRAMIEKLCQKEPREAFRGFMARKLSGMSKEWQKEGITDETVERVFNAKLDANPEPAPEQGMPFIMQ